MSKATIASGDFTDILTTWRRDRLKEYFDRTGSNMVNLMFEHRATAYENMDAEIDNYVSLEFQKSNQPKKEDYNIQYKF